MSTLAAGTSGDGEGHARARIAIARTWRGATRAQDADAYLRYLHETGFRGFRETRGNLGALGLRRIAGDRAEFLLISFWESEAAIRRFAGDDPERAVFYPEDDRFLVERDDYVEHFEVAYRSDVGREASGAGREQTQSHSAVGHTR